MPGMGKQTNERRSNLRVTMQAVKYMKPLLPHWRKNAGKDRGAFLPTGRTTDGSCTGHLKDTPFSRPGPSLSGGVVRRTAPTRNASGSGFCTLDPAGGAASAVFPFAAV